MPTNRETTGMFSNMRTRDKSDKFDIVNQAIWGHGSADRSDSGFNVKKHVVLPHEIENYDNFLKSSSNIKPRDFDEWNRKFS